MQKQDPDVVVAEIVGEDRESTPPRRSMPRLLIGGVSLLGLIGIAGYGLSRYLDADPNSNSSFATIEPLPDGFVMGDLAADQSIQAITVSIETAAGAEISETVDMHLGFGFPLRLNVGDAKEMEPVFAALPTASSLAADQSAIPNGTISWFQFTNADPAADEATDTASDRDPLKTSQTLLQNLKVADITQIGFATKGKSDWTLAGYRIEVNGQLYASNGSFNQSPQQANEINQSQATKLMAQHDVLVRDVRELQTVVKTGLASDIDKQNLVEKEAELAELVEPLQRLGGLLLGHYPVMVENESGYPKTSAATDPVASIRVQLTTGGDQRPGTRNPVYLRAGGRKYLLASEVAPLGDEVGVQAFEISEVDLSFDPVSRNDVENFAIGVLGSNEPFDQIPDRAKLQRVTLEVDGQTIYDSEPTLTDRRSLEKVSLIPPAHRDGDGKVVVNANSDFERYQWNPGIKFSEPVSQQPIVSLPIEPPIRSVAYAVPVIQPGPVPVGGNTPTANSPTSGTGGTGAGGTGAGGTGAGGTGAGGTGAGQPQTQPMPTNPPPIRSQATAGNGTAGNNQVGASELLLAILLKDLLDRLRAAGATTNPSTNSNAGSNNNANPTLVPAPKKLQIKNVRFGSIDRAFSLPTDGDASTVEWEVENAQDVKEFEVKLWARLPHRTNQLPVLLATSPKIGNRSASQVSLVSSSGTPAPANVRAALMPLLDLASSSLEVDEWARAFVEPEVIAFDFDGNVIQVGAAAKGPLMPLRTKDSPQGVFGTGRDRTIQLADQATIERGQFQIDGDGFDAPESTIPWKPFLAQPTTDGKSAWAQTEPTNSHNAISFEVSDLAHVIGIDSGDKNVGQITLRFDNRLELDGNYRLVGHLGFINGSPTTDNEAEISARVIIQDIAWNKSGKVEPHPIADVSSTTIPQELEVLRIATDAAVTYVKQGATTPLMLIDIPIAKNLDYDGYNQALPPDPNQTELFTLAGLTIDPRYEQKKLPLDFVKHAMVSLTLMVKMKNQVEDEAIGLFGLRLVKDPIQPAIGSSGQGQAGQVQTPQTPPGTGQTQPTATGPGATGQTGQGTTPPRPTASSPANPISNPLIGTWIDIIDRQYQNQGQTHRYKGWSWWQFTGNGDFKHEFVNMSEKAGGGFYDPIKETITGTYTLADKKLNLTFLAVDSFRDLFKPGDKEFTTVTWNGDDLSLDIPERTWGEFKRHDPNQPLPKIP